MPSSKTITDPDYEYNQEPVYYCRHCLSLKIRDAGLPDLLYCEDCGSADILSANVTDWENLYRSKYGFKFLDKTYKLD